jgi:hypothetical protein
MATLPQPQPAQDTDNTILIQVPAALFTKLQTTCKEKASVSLIGRIQGKHPGHKALTAWARGTLHPSLTLLTIKTNNLFEISFSEPAGRIHALTQTELLCESANISFSSWKPHFDAKSQQFSQLDYPIWLQIVDLCQVLRDEDMLRTIGTHIGQVIAIDNSEAYRTKLFGPRIRILVRNLDNLPKKVAIPRLDGEGIAEYCVEYSGLPSQCGRCRSLDHQVRHCPRRDLKIHKQDTQKPTLPTYNIVQQPPQKLPPEEPTVEEPPIPDTNTCDRDGHTITGEAATTPTAVNPEQEERPTTPLLNQLTKRQQRVHRRSCSPTKLTFPNCAHQELHRAFLQP